MSAKTGAREVALVGLRGTGVPRSAGVRLLHATSGACAGHAVRRRVRSQASPPPAVQLGTAHANANVRSAGRPRAALQQVKALARCRIATVEKLTAGHARELGLGAWHAFELTADERCARCRPRSHAGSELCAGSGRPGAPSAATARVERVTWSPRPARVRSSASGSACSRGLHPSAALLASQARPARRTSPRRRSPPFTASRS